MNFLAHLFVAARFSDSPERVMGHFMGDFVKGRLADNYPQAIRQGLEDHRQVDLFTDSHERVVELKSLFPEGVRRYSGILLDMYFDFLLSQNWALFSGEDRRAFINNYYLLLNQHVDYAPERLQVLLPRIIEQDWLGCYHNYADIQYAIQRIATRLKEPEKLVEGIEDLDRHAEEIKAAFLVFFPELLEHMGSR